MICGGRRGRAGVGGLCAPSLDKGGCINRLHRRACAAPFQTPMPGPSRARRGLPAFPPHYPLFRHPHHWMEGIKMGARSPQNRLPRSNPLSAFLPPSREKKKTHLPRPMTRRSDRSDACSPRSSPAAMQGGGGASGWAGGPMACVGGECGATTGMRAFAGVIIFEKKLRPSFFYHIHTPRERVASPPPPPVPYTGPLEPLPPPRHGWWCGDEGRSGPVGGRWSDRDAPPAPTPVGADPGQRGRPLHRPPADLAQPGGGAVRGVPVRERRWRVTRGGSGFFRALFHRRAH